MFPTSPPLYGLVNCRIGSLEIARHLIVFSLTVNCRIGSLEICPYVGLFKRKVNCRIGSLEKNGF